MTAPKNRGIWDRAAKHIDQPAAEKHCAKCSRGPYNPHECGRNGLCGCHRNPRPEQAEGPGQRTGNEGKAQGSRPSGMDNRLPDPTYIDLEGNAT